MKKIIPFLGLLLFIISSTSCKKDHTCTCIESGSNPDADAFLYPNSSKNDAKVACNLELTQSQGDYISCEIN
jgi:hypothetical protein